MVMRASKTLEEFGMAGPMRHPLLTEIDGRQLACDLIRELHAEHRRQDEEFTEGMTAEEVSALIDSFISRTPVILRRYLTTARKAGRDVERGFLCVLSDFVAQSAVHAIDPAYYEARLES